MSRLLANLIIGVLFLIVAIPCFLMWPFRVLIDRAAKKHCFHCATREEVFEIIHKRVEGTHKCDKCGKFYTISRA